MKIDPYKHKEKYLNWKERVKDNIPNISEKNSILIKNYLGDMEVGINISTFNAKGSRSYIRLNTLRDKIIFLAKKFHENFGVDYIVNISEEQVHEFFSGMRNGTIKRKDGGKYKSACDFVKDFKAFWHWYQKINRKKGIEISDITIDLDTSKEKPKWVYLNEEQVKKLCDNAKYNYRVLIMFLLDTGIRAPTELINIKISDLSNDCKELNIRDEISKTFGRKIKLMLCSDLIKEYIKGKEGYLFPIKINIVNRYLRRLALRVFGDGESQAGEKYSNLTMYDFRHNSCCYWLPKYKSESALKYRFGWKKSDKIHYYSELRGMKDTISEEDLLDNDSKTEIEKKLKESEKENNLLKERIDSMEKQMEKILELTNELYKKVK